MKFIALDVNVGDSFVLTEGSNVFVVDGGGDQKFIAAKLVKNKIINIDVAICSHYDSDHLNGIIGIIKSPKIKVRELWLPDIFGDIAFTLSYFPDLALELSGKPLEGNTKKTLGNYFEKAEETEEEEKQKDIDEHIYTSTIEKQKDMGKYINVSILEYLQTQLHYCFVCRKHSFSSVNIKYIARLKKILDLIICAKHSGARIRWLKYTDFYNNKKISSYYDLYALNSRKVALCRYERDMFHLALCLLTQINKESLVFRFEKKNLPNVLFTADSDLGFCACNVIQLADNSIVTAPHHGSHLNSCVYRIVQGNNLTYVRSDKFTNKRPCIEYTNLPAKYCTVCRNPGAKKQQVTLEYEPNIQQWHPIKTNSCIC